MRILVKSSKVEHFVQTIHYVILVLKEINDLSPVITRSRQSKVFSPLICTGPGLAQ